MPGPLAHGPLNLDELFADFAQFGTDWLYVAGPAVVALVAAAGLARHGAGVSAEGWVARIGSGAARLTGLPRWAAGPLALLVGVSLPYAVMGFFWDVAWHIDIGRDEFLFSPPHVDLLVALTTIGVAGAGAIWLATRDRADVAWRAGRLRVPPAAAFLVAAGLAATVGWATDELWHEAYGLDVTMWSPPHLTMISAAAFSPLALLLLLAEAGAGRRPRWLDRHLVGFAAGAVLVGLSAWQLEFDLGVPQWQALYHPVLVAFAGAMALTLGRTLLGPGGAVITVGWFVGLRVALWLLTSQLWGLSEPRFPLYLGAALAVEGAFHLTRTRSPAHRALVAGLGVGTVGLASTYGWSQLVFHHPWTPTLLPGVAVALLAALGGAVLGTGFGRTLTYRPAGLGVGALAAATAAVLVALAVPFPRTVPTGQVTLRATPTGEGHAEVRASFDPPTVVENADRFGVLGWQGDGRVLVDLHPAEDAGAYVTAEPVPVQGSWKTIVWLARNDTLAGVPVHLPADPAIDASAVPAPLGQERTSAWMSQSELLLREAHAGPVWPGILAYAGMAAGLGVTLGLLVAATVSLQRRRRGRGWTGPGGGSLAGRRVLLTGAAGGIGRSAREALQSAGARVVGLDLVSDGPDTLAVDVSDLDAVGDAVDRAARRLGGVDVVVANAGIGLAGDSTRRPATDAHHVLDTNLFGVWNTVAAAWPHLPSRGGHVVVVASGLAVVTLPYSAAYTASKRAVTGYADVLRLEAAPRVDVTTVLPGYVRTAIHRQPEAHGATLEGVVRPDTHADAAAAIVAAVEKRPREVTTSSRTTLGLWLARRLPAVADRAVRWRWRRIRAGRPEPDFSTDRRART